MSIEDFKLKVEKLKIMKDAGLLSDEKFEQEQAKLLQLLQRVNEHRSFIKYPEYE